MLNGDFIFQRFRTLNSQLKIEQYNYNVASIPYYDLFLNRVKYVLYFCEND